MNITRHIPQLLTTFVFALSLSSLTHAATDPATVEVLDRAAVDALLAQPNELVILDLRRPDELTNIGGFGVYLSIQLSELGERLDYIPKDRTIVTVSNHAGRAKRAAALLIDAGFKVAGAAGAQDYEAEGGVLSKIQPPAPAAH